MNPRRIGMYVISADQTWFGLEISKFFNRFSSDGTGNSKKRYQAVGMTSEVESATQDPRMISDQLFFRVQVNQFSS
jgi:hypothetical protein